MTGNVHITRLLAAERVAELRREGELARACPRLTDRLGWSLRQAVKRDRARPERTAGRSLGASAYAADVDAGRARPSTSRRASTRGSRRPSLHTCRADDQLSPHDSEGVGVGARMPQTHVTPQGSPGLEPDAEPRSPTARLAGDNRSTLVGSAAAGDEGVWAVLFREFDRMLRGIARAHRLHDDAGDVAHATWLKLFESLDQLREPTSVRGLPGDHQSSGRRAERQLIGNATANAVQRRRKATR